MKGFSKKILGVVIAMAVAITSVTVLPTTVSVKGASLGDDILLEDTKNFGNVSEYAYHYVWLNEASSSYKYMIITYKGDITNLRLQGIKSDKRIGKISWVDQTQPDNLSLIGTPEYQSESGAILVIDLEKSKMSLGSIDALDFHYGPGTLNIGKIRLSKSSKIKSNIDIMPGNVTAPKQTKIKSVTMKKGTKKVKISIKQIKGAVAYRVQFSTTKNFKKVLTARTIKKVNTTITAKQLKNKKNLYVRVKAYKFNVKQRIFAKKWSTVKKVRIK